MFDNNTGLRIGSRVIPNFTSDYSWRGTDADGASYGVIWAAVSLGTWRYKENTTVYGGIRRLTVRAAIKVSNVHGSRFPDYYLIDEQHIPEENQITIGRYLSHFQGTNDDAKVKGISCLTSVNPSFITIASARIFGSRSAQTKNKVYPDP